jgi:hypothetical protein
MNGSWVEPHGQPIFEYNNTYIYSEYPINYLYGHARPLNQW